MRSPHGQRNRSRSRDKICRTFAVLQREGLEEQQTPAGQQEQVSGSCIQVADAEVKGFGQRHEDGVDDRIGDAVELEGLAVARREVQWG